MGSLINLKGKRFDRVIVLEQSSTKGNHAEWECLCDCGEIFYRRSSNLFRSKRQSCGIGECAKTKNMKHGMCYTKEYKVWRGMMARCSNENHEAYADYGGRGIEVCERWAKFENFYEDMGKSPKGLQLDRIKNDGNYCKSNCRWTTPKINSNNRRSSNRITCNGITKTLSEWGDHVGGSRHTVSDRIKKGWPLEMATSIPVGWTMVELWKHFQESV